MDYDTDTLALEIAREVENIISDTPAGRAIQRQPRVQVAVKNAIDVVLAALEDENKTLREAVGWVPLTCKDEQMTCRMPADETVVEVMLNDGTVCRSWFGSNIMEAGDWDFLPVHDDDEPDDEADSLAGRVVAWRAALSKPAVLPAEGKGEGEAFAPTYYDKGHDAEWFENLSDKDFAWEATKASQDLADSDISSVERWIPLVAIISNAADRIERLQKDRDKFIREAGKHFAKTCELADRALAAEEALAAATPPAPQPLEVSAMSYWRSIDTAPEDQHVILATSGGHVGEAIMLVDEDTGQQKWAWALGPLHPNHIPYGWQPMPSPIDFPVPSTGGFDGPTGAE